MKRFSTKLLGWYALHKRALPWRQTKDPYVVWLSEIMLQQTRVAQGLPYFERFWNDFPTVHDLAKASEDAVLKRWQGLGYYSRARNLHKAAKLVIQQYNGNFPSTFEELIKLPGVGPYTASAIASICFDQVCAVVDGNVYRVLARHFDIDSPINQPAGIKTFQALAQTLIDSKAPGAYNQAIMEFGALHCTPKKPSCSTCPLTSSCLAHAHGRVVERPVKIKAKPVKKRYFHYLIPIDQNNNTLLRRRGHKDIWQGLYEFPLIEAQNMLTVDALQAHDDVPKWAKAAHWTKFQEEAVIHKLSHQALHTYFYVIENIDEPLPISWASVSDYAVPRLIERFLDKFIR
jgi:A/G-specific adenine glycosylase